MESKFLNSFYDERNLERLANFFYENKKYAEDHFIEMGFEHIIRDYTDYITPFASPEAKKIASNNKIENLDKHRNARPKVQESELQFEHDPPLSQIISRCMEAKTPKDIQKILASVKVTWITKDQDKKLDEGDKNGIISGKKEVPDEYKNVSWKSKRPPNAYELLGIKTEKI
ncbi:hypothetical protein AGMMS50293_13220 [Spirochaetia bacterium]|nr:hypothetical protein AGMMS50293_13220 [Spirochaetia bacterium]